MNDFESVLIAAQQLPEPDRVRLVYALWDTVPPHSEAPFSDDWVVEIERRAAALDAGTATTVPDRQRRLDPLGQFTA